MLCSVEPSSVYCQKFTVGLNFASEQEADKFHQAVETKVQEKQEKHQRRMSEYSFDGLS